MGAATEQSGTLSTEAMRLLMDPKGVQVGRTPCEVVYRENTLRLKHYLPVTEAASPVPVLMVYALVNRPYILDLLPGRSVVEQFLRGGLQVYLIDWGIPNDTDYDLGLNDYINRKLRHCVERVMELSGSDRVSLFGYCQGGTFSAIYTALHPDQVKTLSLLATPIDFGSEGLLNLWSRKEHFDVDKLVDAYGNIPAWLMNSAFLMLRPLYTTIDKYVQFGWSFFEGKANGESIEHFLAMEKWLSEGIPHAGEAFREFIRSCYQENLLIRNRMKVGGNRVDLKAIRCPLLNIIADNDHIIPPESSESLNNAVGSKDKTILRFPAGHVGLTVGKQAQTTVWPKVVQWITERSRS
jgi:polyhydroxyalkanoate synthase